MKIFNNSRGLSTIAVIGILMIMAFFGTSVVYLLGTSQAIRENQVLSDTSFYVTQAGMEYAVRQIYEGLSPVVAEPGINFAGGSFVIGQQERVVTVTGRMGAAQVTHSLTSPTQADCTRLDVRNARLHSDGRRLSDIQIRKVCLTQVVINQMIFSWVDDGGERLRRIRIGDATVYDNPPGASSGDLLDIADYVIDGNGTHTINEVQFSASMEEKTFTLTLIMGDTTQKVATFEPED